MAVPAASCDRAACITWKTFGGESHTIISKSPLAPGWGLRSRPSTTR
jgi:hypothetical protein